MRIKLLRTCEKRCMGFVAQKMLDICLENDMILCSGNKKLPFATVIARQIKLNNIFCVAIATQHSNSVESTIITVI